MGLTRPAIVPASHCRYPAEASCSWLPRTSLSRSATPCTTVTHSSFGGQDAHRSRLGSPHLTVLGDLPALSVPHSLALHDAVFLITQRLWARWQPESSLAVLLGGAPGDRTEHPAASLFDGFIKSLRWERPGTVAFTLTTDEPVTSGLLTRGAQERTVTDHTWLVPAITGRLDGRPWVDGIATRHPTQSVAFLARLLHTACYIVVAHFSGMGHRSTRRACGGGPRGTSAIG
jgi:hypothetical protein